MVHKSTRPTVAEIRAMNPQKISMLHVTTLEHAKTYRNFAAEFARLQQERIAAFREFIADVNSGVYPEASHNVPISDAEFEAFKSKAATE